MIPAPAVRHPVPVSGGAGFPFRVRGGRGRRIGRVMTLTAVLRVWDLACFAEHGGRVAGAIVQAVVDRGGGGEDEEKR